MYMYIHSSDTIQCIKYELRKFYEPKIFIFVSGFQKLQKYSSRNVGWIFHLSNNGSEKLDLKSFGVLHFYKCLIRDTTHL